MNRNRAQINSGPETPKYLIVQNPDFRESLQLATNTNTNITANVPTVRERREARLNEMRTRYQNYTDRTDSMMGSWLDNGLVGAVNPINLLNTNRVAYFRLPRQTYMQREIRLAEERLARESVESVESVEVQSRQEEMRALGIDIGDETRI